MCRPECCINYGWARALNWGDSSLRHLLPLHGPGLAEAQIGAHKILGTLWSASPPQGCTKIQLSARLSSLRPTLGDFPRRLLSSRALLSNRRLPCSQTPTLPNFPSQLPCAENSWYRAPDFSSHVLRILDKEHPSPFLMIPCRLPCRQLWRGSSLLRQQIQNKVAVLVDLSGNHSDPCSSTNSTSFFSSFFYLSISFTSLFTFSSFFHSILSTPSSPLLST